MAVLWLLATCMAALWCPLAASAATEHHLYDPKISLTGGCTTDALDPVADPWCPGPPGPTSEFENPNVTVDAFGDIYVSSHDDVLAETTGRVDVFSPTGRFITELFVRGARSIAVDPKGNLYVHQFIIGEAANGGVKRVTLFRPDTPYDPAAEEISYGTAGEVIIENVTLSAPCSAENAPFLVGLAVDPVTEHLFVSPGGGCVAEWSSAEEGPKLLDNEIGVGFLTPRNKFLAVDAEGERLYVSDVKNPDNGVEGLIQVFDLGGSHAHLGSLDGSETPSGKFLAHESTNTLDVDEKTGNLFVSDLTSVPRVYEMGPGLDDDEEVLHTYEQSGFSAASPYEIAVDNAPGSPNYRSFFVPSEKSGKPHVFAFRFSEEGEPEIESAGVAGVTETEAVLQAVINPGGGEARYRFEYTTESSFAANGFDGAVVAAQGTLPASLVGTQVSGPIAGLNPGTSYRFRVFAENGSASREVEGRFRTFTSAAAGPCSNESLRVGFSALLPDCRAYELVSPADTNGRSPVAAGEFGLYFPTLQASPDGNKATFRIEGGVIPGSEGTGSFNGDNYLTRRGATGWVSQLAGPTGTDAVFPQPGGFSPDQEHSLWQGDISAAVPYNEYIRYPDGHSERVGRGSLGVDPLAQAWLIGGDGAHLIFNSSPRESFPAVQLEPNAPPAGTVAVYDRTADEVTHVVSLLPGDETPAAGENAFYVGASLDGEGVAFELGQKTGETLYLRQDNEETYEIGQNLTFAGIVEGGGRIFYLQSGNIFAFDTASKTRIQFSKGGDATPVNISADGSTVYFVSPDVLTGQTKNPTGAIAQAGEENLYVSRGGNIGFVGTVEPPDVEEAFGGSGQHLGLGQWVQAVQGGKPAIDTSRTTPDGRVLLFESRASLAGYDPEGHTEIYRYDSVAGTLSCLSCNPTGAAATSSASLQTILREGGKAFSIIGLSTRVLNIRPGGDRAFFQSYEALVQGDVDGKQDVYEWEEQGVGSCNEAGGCVHLISFGQSDSDEHLFAASESGDDAFFLSGSLLLGADHDPTPSIYDARVGGGFPEEAASSPCQGEGCRGDLTPPPSLPAPATPALGKSGNVATRHCGKGKRKVRRHGKTRCVKKHRHHRKHHRAAAKGGGSK